jgi:hypothetical protein
VAKASYLHECDFEGNPSGICEDNSGSEVDGTFDNDISDPNYDKDGSAFSWNECLELDSNDETFFYLKTASIGASTIWISFKWRVEDDSTDINLFDWVRAYDSGSAVLFGLGQRTDDNRMMCDAGTSFYPGTPDITYAPDTDYYIRIKFTASTANNGVFEFCMNTDGTTWTGAANCEEVTATNEGEIDRIRFSFIIGVTTYIDNLRISLTEITDAR